MAGIGSFFSQLCAQDRQSKVVMNLLYVCGTAVCLVSAGVHQLISKYHWLPSYLNHDLLILIPTSILFHFEVWRRVIADICRASSIGYVSPYVNVTIDRTNSFPWTWKCHDLNPWLTMLNFSTEHGGEDAGCTARVFSPGALITYTLIGCFIPFSTGAKGSTTLILCLTQIVSIAVTGVATGLEASAWMSTALFHGEMLLANVFICGRRYASAKREYEQERRLRAAADKLGDFLGTLIPKPLHHRLKSQAKQWIAGNMEHCSVMFVSLSPSATELFSPSTLETFQLIDNVFTRLDTIVDEFGYFKYHHVQDTYVICCPRTSRPFHAPDCPARYKQTTSRAMVALASRIIEEVQEFRALSGEPLWVKVGIACGPLAGAIVGAHRRFYCLFGDTINTSARMCHYSEKDKILCTEEFLKQLGLEKENAGMKAVSRPEMHIKGKGAMTTYFIELEDSSSSSSSSSIRRGIFPSTGMRKASVQDMQVESPQGSQVIKIDDPISTWLEIDEIVSTEKQQESICKVDFKFLDPSLEESFLISHYSDHVRQALVGSICYTVSISIILFRISRLSFFHEKEASSLRQHVVPSILLGCAIFLLLSSYLVYLVVAGRLRHTDHRAHQSLAVKRFRTWQALYVCGHLVQFAIMFYSVWWTRATGWLLVLGPIICWINLQQTNVPARWYWWVMIVTYPMVIVQINLLLPRVFIGEYFILAFGAYASYRVLIDYRKSERSVWMSQHRNEMEHEAILHVLNDLFPRDVVEEALSQGQVASSYRKAAVLRLDLCNYMELTGRLQPMEVAKLIHDVYRRFDQCLADSRIFKLDTIGDEYICAGWLQGGEDKKLCRTMHGIAESMLAIIDRTRSKDGKQIACRIGIAAGICVAGTMGKLQPRFHALGDAMNEALEMQKKAKPGTICCSKEFENLLKGTETHNGKEEEERREEERQEGPTGLT